MEAALFFAGFVLAAVVTAAEASPVSAGLLPDMPPGCNGHLYCTAKHDKYPDREINNLLKQNGVSLGHVHETNLWRDTVTTQESQNDCQKNVTYSLIYEILDIDEKVRVVVQATNFTQWFRIEKCSHTGRLTGSTAHFDSLTLLRHNITCEQETVTYSFLALTLDGKSFESVRSGPIPVYCACKLRKDVSRKRATRVKTSTELHPVTRMDLY